MKNTIIISITTILASLIITFGMTHIMHEVRTVTVRGLCEKEVDADMAVWKVSYSIPGNELIPIQEQLQEKTKILEEYLAEFQLTKEDYSILAPEITDTNLNLYIDKSKNDYRYLAKQSILIRSGKVANVKDANSETQKLLSKGIAIESDYDNHISYEFNGLNEIKPEMIAKATESARQAAEQFAHDSKSRVGKIQSATQGLFTIENAAVGLEEKKRVRVVTTVVYTLID